jgi:hypothetical protein
LAVQISMLVFSVCSVVRILFTFLIAILFAGAAWGAEEPGARALQEQQLMRQQQQDALQLRLQQQQRSLQSPPPGPRERQERERLQIMQEQKQQELHYRQKIEPPTAHLDDDAGVQGAKAQMQRQRAKEQGEQQLQRFDSELQGGIESKGAKKARGEVQPPEPPAPLQ